MEFNYKIADAKLLLTPERGFELECGCRMEEPQNLTLKSGRKWAEALHSLRIYPASTGPYQEPFPDGRVGEFRPGILDSKGHDFYKAWLQFPDDQFNVLYSQLAAKNSEVHIQLCFNEDKTPATAIGMYDDTAHVGENIIPVLTYRAWVTLIPYVKTGI